MMRTRALFMINSMRGGGSEQQTLLLLRYLDRALFEPQLYLTHRQGDLLASVPSDVAIHSYDEIEGDGGIYFPGRAIRRQTRHLTELLGRENIDVIYDRTFHMTMVAGPAAATQSIPRVSTIVSPPDQALPMVEKRFVGLKRYRLSRAYQQSASVIAVSHQAAKSAESYYGLRDRSVVVIPNPVDVDRLLADSKRTSPTRDERLTIVCVARMSEEKGHRDLIGAIAIAAKKWPESSRPLRIWMVGDGPLRAELESESKKIPSPHQVEFLGGIANPAPLIKAADALILPSHFEGMPNVVLEAMALGTPVIATRAGGTMELQRETPTLLMAEPSNAESLAEAILLFESDPQAAKLRVEAAKAMVQSDHNAASIVDRVQERLRNACGH